MEYLFAVLLGLVQGLTEFLPVSSSGHLVLTHQLLGFEGPQIAYDVLLHLGTLLAVIIYFRSDLLQIFYTAVNPSSEYGGRRWILMIIIASIPTAIIGFAFEEVLEKQFGDPRLVSLQLWCTALLLVITDRVWIRESAGRKVKAHQALLVGVAQGIAIIPGISRSGATIATGVFCGLNRNVAARFSFLISIPAIFGASLLELDEIVAIRAQDVLPYLLGVLVAFITGYLSIDILLRILVKRKLWKFAVYLFGIGLLGLIFY